MRSLKTVALAIALLCAGCTSGAPPAPTRPPDPQSGAKATAPAADAPARPAGGAATSAPQDTARKPPARPSAAVSMLQGPNLTDAEQSQFIAGLLATPIEHRVRMADTLYRCGMSDALLPAHLWVYAQRLPTRDQESGLMSDMGFGFHQAYAHFAEPTLFFFIEELNHGSPYHKWEVDYFLQWVTLQFEDVELETVRKAGWLSKRANQWLSWYRTHEGGNRVAWAMEALDRQPPVHPERTLKVLEELTGVKPFADKVDPFKPEDVSRRIEVWRAWWQEHRDYVYWFEDERGPLLQPFPKWWNSELGKQERETGLYRIDAVAKGAGIPSRTYRQEHPWPLPRR